MLSELLKEYLTEGEELDALFDEIESERSVEELQVYIQEKVKPARLQAGKVETVSQPLGSGLLK